MPEVCMDKKRHDDHLVRPDNGRVVTANPWQELRRFTPARIALGRTGVSLPTRPHLEFQLAHAQARQAVQQPADFCLLDSELQALGESVVLLRSAADSRAVYLQRPDLGRRLDAASAELLAELGADGDGQPPDVVIVIGDGLSSRAINSHAVPLLQVLLPALHEQHWRVGPLVLVKHARVAVGDEVGAKLRASLVVVLIGERPGLSSPDSLGIYMTWQPRVGTTDDLRNCISNIRPQGLSYPMAVHRLLYLMTQARKLRLSGVALKDNTDTESLPGG